MNANYKTILDDPKDLKVGADTDWDLDFNLPNTMAIDKTAVLTFMVQSTGGGSQGLHAKVYINGHDLFTYGPTNTDLSRPFQVLFQDPTHPILQKGNNNIAIKLLGGLGTFRFSDVVVWFKDTPQ
jgi:hypothetical protein